jgi:hypothetical protein
VFIVLSIAVLYYAQLCAFKSRFLTWTLTVAICWYYNLIKALVRHLQSEKSHEFVIVVVLMALRLLAFCIDRICAEEAVAGKADAMDDEKKKDKYGILNFAFYSLYPSFLFKTMFVSYDNFRLCVSFCLSLIYRIFSQSYSYFFIKI